MCPCVDFIEVLEFRLGSSNPYIKHVHAYECMDRVGGGKQPVTWTNVGQCLSVLYQTGTCQLTIEAAVDMQSDDFVLVLRSHMAGKW